MTTLAGRYEVTETLGGGGFAITYLARDILQPSKPLCVVKQLRPNQTHPRVIDFFHKEAAILEKLGKHPHIPQLLAHFQEGDNLYIVQEFIQGQDLSKEISPGKLLSEDYVLRLLQDVLEILSFVHKYGVIHRDIKPQNLMRRQEDGKIFLIDFGAVKELGSLMVNTNGEIASSVVIGTPGYMSNEQGLGKPCLASDLYALGMIAIQALTGLQPFELEENPQTGEVIWLEKAQVSQHLTEVITKLVRRHYSLRYSSATDALQALTNPLESIPIPPTELNPPEPPATKHQQPSQSNSQTPLTSTNKSSNNWQRRKVIQTMGLVSGGFIAAILGQRILQGDDNEKSNISNNPNDLSTQTSSEGNSNIDNLQTTVSNKTSTSSSNLNSFDFETVTVNAKGNTINRQSSSANYFTEDLDNGVTLEMVEIPGGEFLMGSPSDENGRSDYESPQHKVTVKPFFMGRFTITQAQYEAIMNNNLSTFKGKQRPADQVAWNDVTEFCKKLTEKTGRTYRLPSEAEWEYACRAGTTTPFHFGETITSNLANYRGNSTYADAPKGEYREETIEVGSFPPNAFGLYDMHGNVWEWCQDSWHLNYKGAPNDGSAWINNNPALLDLHILRGGSWKTYPRLCRSAYRFNSNMTKRIIVSDGIGFRVVCNSVPNAG